MWGPGHGNMFYDEGTDEYIFLYLEYGDGGTTRQVYANRMEFNDDGTIKTLVPDMRGVGYLAGSQETGRIWHYSRIFMLPARKPPHFRG